MVPCRTKCVSGGYHFHHKPQSVRVPRPSVRQITDEYRLAPIRMGITSACVPISEFQQQFFQLITASMHIPDNVKRPVFFRLVVPEFCIDNLDVFYLFLGKDINVAEALPFQTFDAFLQGSVLAPDRLRGEVPAGSLLIPEKQCMFRNIQHDSGGVNILLFCKFQDRLAVYGLQVSRVDHRPLSKFQSCFGRLVQKSESLLRDGLVIFIIADHFPEKVGRQDKRVTKMPVRECRFPAG